MCLHVFIYFEAACIISLHANMAEASDVVTHGEAKEVVHELVPAAITS